MARPSLHVTRLLKAGMGRLPYSASLTPVRAFTAAAPHLQRARTGLYDLHVKNGGKLVEFGGYDMPLSYGSVGQSELYLCSSKLIADKVVSSLSGQSFSRPK
jgi:hypothetical protein